LRSTSTSSQTSGIGSGCRTAVRSAKGFELRFDMGRSAWRITYWYRPDAVIVMLTVFRKQRNNERAEVVRSRKAFDDCRKLHQPKS
jgi:putative component of toxin-antitoxin plasmid stabilization module